MNENIVTDASGKKAVFTVKRIIQVLSLLCIAFVFCPSFLVSCSGEDIKVNVMTAVKGIPGDGEWLVRPHIFMLVCLLIPIFVFVFLYLNKFGEKQTAAIIMGCTAVDFVIWLIFRANVKRIAEESYCFFMTTGWYKINLIVMLLIILLSALVVLNVVRLNKDLIVFFSSGGTQNALRQMFDIINQMLSIKNNKDSGQNMIGFCSKCKTALPYGCKFCMSCGTLVSESLSVEKEAENKIVEEGTVKDEKLVIMKVIGILLIILGTIGFLMGLMMYGDIGIACIVGALSALLSGSGSLLTLKKITVTQMSDNVVSGIKNNKDSGQNTVGYCSKCKTALPYGCKFCMSCGTLVSESLPAEEEAENKVVEEVAVKNVVEEDMVRKAEEAKKVAEEEIEQTASERAYDMSENTESVAKGFCVECGAQLRNNVKFCTKCGTRINLRKIDMDRQNSEEVQSQKSAEKISGKPINKIAIATIVVIVISVIAGGFVYIRIRRTDTGNAENITTNMQDLLEQQKNEQSVKDLLEQQKNEQFDSEIVETDNAKADEAQNTTVETQNEHPKAPQVIQLDSRYIKSIQASSELADSTKTYKVETVLDGDKETCWSEGADGTGEGEFIYIEFTSPVYISEIAFLNGYMKNETVYNANGKIKSAELMFDNESYEVEFVDWQYQEIENALYSDRFTLDTPVQTQSLSIMILEAQKGAKYDDICLTELGLWGYADNMDRDISTDTLSVGGENFDIYDLYDNVLDEIRIMYGSDCEYALYDIDHDGVVELITSQGTCNADWSNTVYTVDGSGMLVEVGTFYGMVSLYAAENENGIYSVYGHMGYQEVEWITKNGNNLHTETILSGETVEYYENDNPIPMVGIDEDIMNY